MPLKRTYLFLSLFLISMTLAGCTASRMRLLSLTNYSEEELVSLYRLSRQRSIRFTTLKAWFKAKITTPDHKDFFRGALYWESPDALRLERWGMMNQLNAIVVSRNHEAVAKIPPRNLYLVGDAAAFSAQFWGEEVLLEALPALLTGRPPLTETKKLQIKRVGRLLELVTENGQRYQLGFHPLTRKLIFQAKTDRQNNISWEIFYDKPEKFSGGEFMSRVRLNVGAHTQIELNLQKLYLNQPLKPGLFKIVIPPNADVEPFTRTNQW